MYYFTADEHYGHANISGFTGRPFEDVHTMNCSLIEEHNKVVTKEDIVIHAGDFCWGKQANHYIKRLNGQHIFLRGSHDKWLGKDIFSNQITYEKKFTEIWEKKIKEAYLVICHYAMRVWPRSHYNSWHLYGHSHGNLEPIGKQLDVGVDSIYKIFGEYRPISFEEVKEYMKTRPDNPNLVRKRK
jgi:calcineurin-like phosphoesterase family protein